jgi:hypothetical protein
VYQGVTGRGQAATRCVASPCRRTLVKNGAGDLFGIITTPDGIVAVNDGTNNLELFRG